jgi:hypothetical protein
MAPGSWIPDPGSRILDRGPRAPFWAMGYPKGPWPRSFLDGPGGLQSPGGIWTAMLRWIGLGAGCHRRQVTQWALGSKHKMYIWHVCIYLYLGEP